MITYYSRSFSQLTAFRNRKQSIVHLNVVFMGNKLVLWFIHTLPSMHGGCRGVQLICYSFIYIAVDFVAHIVTFCLVMSECVCYYTQNDWFVYGYLGHVSCSWGLCEFHKHHFSHDWLCNFSCDVMVSLTQHFLYCPYINGIFKIKLIIGYCIIKIHDRLHRSS